jgi:hypothetical protein
VTRCPGAPQASDRGPAGADRRPVPGPALLTRHRTKASLGPSAIAEVELMSRRHSNLGGGPPRGPGHYSQDGRRWWEDGHRRWFPVTDQEDQLEIEAEDLGATSLPARLWTTLVTQYYRFVRQARSADRRWPTYRVTGASFPATGLEDPSGSGCQVRPWRRSCLAGRPTGAPCADGGGLDERAGAAGGVGSRDHPMALLACAAAAGGPLAPTTTQLVTAPRAGADRGLEKEREQLSRERLDAVGLLGRAASSPTPTGSICSPRWRPCAA